MAPTGDDSAAAADATANAGNEGAAAPEAPKKPARKERVRKPEKPSRESLESDVVEVNKSIDECNRRIGEIKDTLDKHRQGKLGVDQEVQEVKTKLASTIAQFRAVLDQKKALKDEMTLGDDTRKRMRDELKALRDRLPFVKVEQIDEEVKKLEYRLQHSTMTLAEEKKIIQQIKDLAKTREFVREYNERMDRVTADEGNRAELMKKIKERDDQLNALKAQEQKQKAEIEEIRAKGREGLLVVDVQGLVEEREAKYEEIRNLREKIKQLRIEFKEKENEYWEKEREWRAQQAEDRKKAYDEREAMRKEREARRKAWEVENYVEPYTEEIIICDQLLAYISTLGGPSGSGEGGESKGDGGKAAPVEAVAKGFGKMVVSKKNKGDEDLDGWFGGTSGKGGKKKGGKQRDRGERYVSHSIDAIASFGKIKVTPPTSTGELEEANEAIKAKKEEFQKLQVEEREKKKAAEEEAEKAKAAAAAAAAAAPASGVTAGEAAETSAEEGATAAAAAEGLVEAGGIAAAAATESGDAGAASSIVGGEGTRGPEAENAEVAKDEQKSTGEEDKKETTEDQQGAAVDGDVGEEAKA